MKNTLFGVLRMITLLHLCSFLNAQQMIVSNYEIHNGTSNAVVPVLIIPPSNTTAYQLSILWPVEVMVLDSLVFSEVYTGDEVDARWSNPNPGELRVLVSSRFGTMDPLKMNPDSIGFKLYFTISDQFTGSANLEFNPDFPNIFAGHAQSTSTTNGSVVTTNTTSDSEIGINIEALNVYPNPTRDQFQVLGLPSSTRYYNYTIVDASGRMVTRGQLMENSLVSSESIPPGVYFLRVNLEDRLLVTPLVIVTR